MKVEVVAGIEPSFYAPLPPDSSLKASPLSPILFLSYNAPLLEVCATTTTAVLPRPHVPLRLPRLQIRHGHHAAHPLEGWTQTETCPSTRRRMRSAKTCVGGCSVVRAQLVKFLPTGSLPVYSDRSMGDSGMVGAGVAGRQWVGGSKVVLEEGEEVEDEGCVSSRILLS